MSAVDVERELRRIHRLLDLIAREHKTQAPREFTVAELLTFLDELGESAAEFFTLAFMPWSSLEEFEREVESVRETFRALNSEGGIEDLLKTMLDPSAGGGEGRFQAEESTESIRIPEDLHESAETP